MEDGIGCMIYPIFSPDRLIIPVLVSWRCKNWAANAFRKLEMTRFGLSSNSENPVAASGVQLERIRKKECRYRKTSQTYIA